MDCDNQIYSVRQMATQAKKIAESICPGFIIDDNLRPVINALCRYFCNDPLFEKEGHGKLNKGIALLGNVGTGKTILMKAFQNNPRKDFEVVNTIIPTDKYQFFGLDNLKPYYGYYGTNGSSPKAYCFDDLGCEPISINHMGTAMNVMERIILIRYERREHVPFYFTHFTSNLSKEQIENIYGSRVLSRLREMCNVFVLTGDDRRK